MAVIKIIGLATGHVVGVEDTYVQEYTPHGFDGKGDLVVTDDKAKAKQYASMGEAMLAWREVSNTHPTRPDGKPNRPMTAFTVEVEK